MSKNVQKCLSTVTEDVHWSVGVGSEGKMGFLGFEHGLGSVANLIPEENAGITQVSRMMNAREAILAVWRDSEIPYVGFNPRHLDVPFVLGYGSVVGFVSLMELQLLELYQGVPGDVLFTLTKIKAMKEDEGHNAVFLLL
ncbi:hypothetical protein DUI87_15615 [Hirundo rustica rustica]|uniref:Uncharacterized protein n=1 Tax=Hirundo rustica rustica TaxID=333673 RepID=A0A3M0JZB1_HIRRU|nr:hypothetical protein DUI87_15615 [Hirundo rustica rustica]